MTKPSSAAGLAALSICEAILLTLIEEGLVDRDRIQELLEDALEGHLAPSPNKTDADAHERAAMLIEQIVISLNAAERSPEAAKPQVSSKLTAMGPKQR